MSYFAFPNMDYTLSWSTQGIHTTERTTEKAKTDKNIAARDRHKCVYEIDRRLRKNKRILKILKGSGDNK